MESKKNENLIIFLKINLFYFNRILKSKKKKIVTNNTLYYFFNKVY